MVNKITGPITPLDEINKINEIIDEVDEKLENTATGTNALTIIGTASGYTGGTNIGASSQAKQNYGTAIGFNTNANGNSSTCIGRNAGTSAASAIQIGAGVNSTANTLQVGFIHASTNYQLLDGTTGKIPSDRIKYDGTTITVNANGELTSTGGGDSGFSRNIGEIVTSTIPLIDAGLHLLDGALISSSGSYGDFVTYISGLVSTYPDLFTTESDWQSTVTQYGVCGKFVYDSVANTVRLPKYSDKIYTQELDTTAPVVGNGMSLGLTNGTVNAGLSHNTASPYHLGGAPTGYGASVGAYAPTTNALGSQIAVGITSDASYSGIIAQLSDITTALDGYYYIVVATTTKTDIEVDIDEIATDLNGKADTDLLNVPESRGILVEKSSKDILPRWYRVYSDGWCEQGGVNTVSSTSVVASLLKNYINNNYSVMTQGYRNTYNVNNTTNIQILSKSNSQINMACATTTLSIEWQACGYIR